MVRDPVIPPEGFEETLAWLNPDRDVAAEMYVQLRRNLSTLFAWKGVQDPEGLTDEVFDRVARKVRKVRATYEGDPRHYFRAVANNVLKEHFRKIKTQLPIEGVDNLKQPMTSTQDENQDRRNACLKLCLQELDSDKQELILAYYAKEKRAKIDHRNELAQRFAMPVGTLRVKVHRIRESLEHCIERCLKREVPKK